MTIAFLFFLGIGNFALHKAVLESGHPMFQRIASPTWNRMERVSLLAEFAALLAAMMLAANGWAAVAWLYLGYSALNACAAWLILGGRI